MVRILEVLHDSMQVTYLNHPRGYLLSGFWNTVRRRLTNSVVYGAASLGGAHYQLNAEGDKKMGNNKMGEALEMTSYYVVWTVNEVMTVVELLGNPLTIYSCYKQNQH